MSANESEDEILRDVPLDACPPGWVYCQSCQTAFSVDRSLEADPQDDRCPVCGNDELTYVV